MPEQQTIGWLRVGVLVLFCLASSVWTVFLAVMNLAPTETANYMMNTTQYDDGAFWQLAQVDASIRTASVVGLGTVAIVYMYLIVHLVWPLRRSERRATMPTGSLVHPIATLLMRPFGARARERAKTIARVYDDLVHINGRYRKLWNLAMEIPEVICQTVTLHSLLANGISRQLVLTYATAMVINSGYSFYHITIAWQHHTFQELVGDAVLDVVFAVAFPAATLLNSIHEFRGGLQVMAIREAFFPARPYERRGQLFGDPRQINTFTTAYDCLRVLDAVDFVGTVGFNLLACLRWRRIIVTLQRPVRRAGLSASMDSILPTTPCSADAAAASQTCTQSDRNKMPALAEQPPKETPKPPIGAHLIPIPHRVVPAFVGVLFLAYGVIAAAYTVMAISASTTACAPLAGCALYAHQWFPGAPDMACPCLVFLGGNLFRKPSETGELEDVTLALSLAAEAGTLRKIQAMNVGLQGTLPANVRLCGDLRQLILLNTDVAQLPSGWDATFAKLEYLHITTGSNSGGLQSIPPRFFASMGALRTLTLERHIFLSELPSFQGLTRLETLIVNCAYSLTSLPALEDTPRLGTLALIDNQALAWLPDLKPVQNTLTAVFINSCPVCCSGFLSLGVCNLTNTSCISYEADAIEHSCYPTDLDTENDPSLVVGSERFPLISDASRAVLQPFLESLSVCDPAVMATRMILMARAYDGCDGVWYRQCLDDGICFSTTLETPHCVKSAAVIAMRQALIRAGDACDPTEEAWLGCQA